MDSPHGHGGYLSPCHGTCLTAGPLSPEIAGGKSQDGGTSRAASRKRAREAATSSGESSDQSKILEERMVTAFETSVDLLARSEERKERTGKDKGEKIKALLNECGAYMTSEEKMRWGRQLMSIYIKDIEGNHDGAAQGEGGGGL